MPVTIVHVAPIAKGIGKERLSYFTSRKVAPGMLVTVPLRKREVPAMVITCEDAAEIKSSLRSGNIAMRKVSSVGKGHFFLPSFLSAVEKIANYHASTQGAVLEVLTPKAIWSAAGTVRTGEAPSNEKTEVTDAIPPEGLVFQAPDRERFAAYKSTIRETFAKKKSVFFCVPEKNDTGRAQALLEKGIEAYTFIFHSGLGASELLARWNAALKETHPILIIATPSFLSMPRGDVGAIIADKEGTAAYKQDRRPFLDFRTALKIYAKERRLLFIFGDIFLRPETITLYKAGGYASILPLQFHLLSPAETNVVSMTKKRTSPSNKKEFSVFSEEATLLLKHSKETNANVFLFTMRRGHYTLTTCNDCGQAVRCPSCKTPLILHTGGQDRIFLCHKCGYEEPVHDQCFFCFGWKLVPLGLGAERIAKAVTDLLPGQPIFTITKDTTTPAKAAKTAHTFLTTPGGILIGTEMALATLSRNISTIIVVSLDSLFAIPDFRINERIFRLLLRLRELASSNFLIQTRRADEPLFRDAKKGDLAAFYKSELQERKTLGYPPAAMLLKLSVSGSEFRAREIMEDVRRFLEEYRPIVFPAFIPHAPGRFTIHAVIKLKPAAWPDEALIQKLRRLPPAVSVDIEPKHLL